MRQLVSSFSGYMSHSCHLSIAGLTAPVMSRLAAAKAPGLQAHGRSTS
jgi:hypothetical protein